MYFNMYFPVKYVKEILPDCMNSTFSLGQDEEKKKETTDVIDKVN